MLQYRVVVINVSRCGCDHVCADGASDRLGLRGSRSIGNMLFKICHLTTLAHVVMLFGVTIPFCAEIVLQGTAVGFSAAVTLSLILAGCSATVVSFLIDHTKTSEAELPMHFRIRKSYGIMRSVISVDYSAYFTGGFLSAAR